MMDHAVVVLIFVAAIGSGLMGGFFFAFSAVVMAALGRLPPQQGMAAMQSINITVLNPLFFLFFFGTGAVCLLLIAASVIWWTQLNAALILAASFVYLVGCIGVTMARNVPLNNALAAVKAGTPEGATLWSRYLVTWTGWNHVRTVTCLAAAAAFTVGLCN